jgi:CRISPR system Cascade subunit CasD
MVDYHTVQTPVQRKGRVFYSRKDEVEQKLESAEKLNTILSRREYVEQAYYTVALAYKEQSASSWTFQQIAAALRAPTFTLYLGRKSCPPALPLAPLVIECESVFEALESYPLPEKIVCGLSFDKDVLISSDELFEGAVEYLTRDVPNYERRAWKDGGRRLFDDRMEYQGIVSNFLQRDEISSEEAACI